MTPREAEEHHSRLEERVNFDELTGHFNRTRLREAIDRAISEGMRRPGAAAFLALGIDNMRAINERFGRTAADTVLIEIGRRLDDCLRVSDLVGRLGGDRYGILLPHCPTNTCRSLQRRFSSPSARRRLRPSAERCRQPCRSALHPSVIAARLPTKS